MGGGTLKEGGGFPLFIPPYYHSPLRPPCLLWSPRRQPFKPTQKRGANASIWNQKATTLHDKRKNDPMVVQSKTRRFSTPYNA